MLKKNRHGILTNRCGFTILEVMIASALIIALAVGGATGFRQISLLNQVAATRVSHSEMHTKVMEVLADSGGCADSLGAGTVGVPMIGGVLTDPMPLPLIRQMLAVGGYKKVLESGGEPQSDGLRYVASLQIVNPISTDFKSGFGRAGATKRYQTELEIRGERQAVQTGSAPQAAIYARIPLSAEFDTVTGRLVSCTLHPEDMDEVLAGGGGNTVRDCLKVNGAPIPTDQGLICRIPVETDYFRSGGGTIPNCPAGWTNVMANGVHYNTTLSMDWIYGGCKPKKIKTVGGWHTLGPILVEVVDVPVNKKKLGANIPAGAAVGFLGAGVTMGIIMAAGVALSVATLGIGLVIGAVIGAILSIFSSCKSVPVKHYSQVNGIGCQ